MKWFQRLKQASKKLIWGKNSRSNNSSYLAHRSNSNRWITFVTSYKTRKLAATSDKELAITMQTCLQMLMQVIWPLVNNHKNIIIKVPKRHEIKIYIKMEQEEIKGKPWQMSRYSRRMEVLYCLRATKACTCRISWHRATSNNKHQLEVRASEPWSNQQYWLCSITGTTLKTHYRISYWAAEYCQIPPHRASKARCQERATDRQIHHSPRPYVNPVVMEKLHKLKKWRSKVAS